MSEAAVTALAGPPDLVTGLDPAFAAVTYTAYTFRDCYLECSARGYSQQDCGQACGGLLHPEDVLTTQTPGGPCSGFWDCFGKGFQVPTPVLRAPGELVGLGKWVVVGVVALVALNVLRVIR